MPDIKDTVGDGGKNAKHDVALVEAMLRVVKNAKALPYFGGDYDGTYKDATKNAIIKFQNDHGLAAPAGAAAPPAGTEKSGLMAVGGPTVKKLAALLPATHANLAILENTRTVFLTGDAAAATTSETELTKNVELLTGFRENVAKLVQQMFAAHKIVLSLASSGGRRTFAKQLVLWNTYLKDPQGNWLLDKKGNKVKPTYAGPGESNHNFGRAVDVGPNGLDWLKGDGTIQKNDDWWLNRLNKASGAKHGELYGRIIAARDAIAVGVLGLFRLVPGKDSDPPHLQSFDDTKVNSAHSLAKLLNKVGTMKWSAVPGSPNKYKSDLGFGGKQVEVGTAAQIYDQQALVTMQMIAQASGQAVAKIKMQQVLDMKKSLKAEFDLAETNWKDWEPAP